MASDALGIALVLGGTFLSAFGYVAQKRAHVAASLLPEASRRPLWRSPWWSGGLVAMIVSAGLVVASAPLLDQSKAGTLGAATLVFTTALSSVLLGERFLLLHAGSTLVIILGSVVAVSANGEGSTALESLGGITSLFDAVAITYSLLMGGAVLCAAVWIERLTRTPAASWSPRARLTLALAAPAVGGACNGWVGYAVKALSTVAANSEWSAAGSAPFWGFALVAVGGVLGQVRFLNKGLAFFSATRVVPTFQCAIILSNALAGIVYFHDLRAQKGELAVFFAGALLCTAGVLLLLLQPDAPVVTAAGTGEPLMEKGQGGGGTSSTPAGSDTGGAGSEGAPPAGVEGVGGSLDDARARSAAAGAAPVPFMASAPFIEWPEAPPGSGSSLAGLSPPVWYLQEVGPVLRHAWARVRGSASSGSAAYTTV